MKPVCPQSYQKNSIWRSIHPIFRSVVLLLVLSQLAFNTVHSGGEQVNAQDDQLYYEPLQRFGIATPFDFTADQLQYFNISAVLDWRLDNSIELPEGIEYIHVVRVSDALFQNQFDNLDVLITQNPGETWIIGNEPDRYYWQDSISPEKYAERYFLTAMKIRSFDPTAKLGFGTVVQPTPIRMRYLDRTLDALDLLTGGRETSLALIDIWSIHAFILNEHPFQWGAGIPVGFFPYEAGDEFEEDWDDAIQITDYDDTYSIQIFMERITNFRYWLDQKGEQEKPLWISEYGSLFPPIDPPDGPNYVNVSDEDTSAFMLDSFDFLLSASDEPTGMPADDFHLVQRWFWYSLNDHRYSFGGSLLDPDQDYSVTLVGENFKDYTRQFVHYFLYLPLVMR